MDRNCETTYDWVAYLQNELEGHVAQEHSEHLQDCTACQAEVEGINAVRFAVHDVPMIEPSPFFKTKVVDALLEEHPEFGLGKVSSRMVRSQRNRSWLTILRERISTVPMWAVSVGVHMLLLAVLALFFLQTNPPRTNNTHTVEIADTREPLKYDREKLNETHGIIQPDTFEPTFSEDTGSAGEFVRRPDRTPLGAGGAQQGKGSSDPDLNMDSALRDADLRVRVGSRLASLPNLRGDQAARNQMRKQYGGEGTQPVVESALGWLASTQEENGSWAPEKYDGEAEYQIGTTGLALLSFLAEGNSHLNGPHSSVVDGGVNWLLQQQQTEGQHAGLFGPAKGHYMYNHGLAALAVMEDFLLTRDSRLKMAVEMAVGYIVHAQNNSGGWGYASRDGDDDTSVTGWQVMVLKLAQSSGNMGVARALRIAEDYIARVTNEAGKTGYRGRDNFPNGHQAMTAVAMFTHQITAISPDERRLAKQESLLLSSPPKVHGAGDEAKNDLYYWYFGSLAMYQRGGVSFQKWNEAIRAEIEPTQESTGENAGSFPTNDRWSGYGGRIYSTAMATLIFQTYYRYPKLG